MLITVLITALIALSRLPRPLNFDLSEGIDGYENRGLHSSENSIVFTVTTPCRLLEGYKLFARTWPIAGAQHEFFTVGWGAREAAELNAVCDLRS